MDDPSIREIALAAFLHDIGKFAQRAGAEELRSADLEALLAPKSRFDEFYSHRHVLYTHGFIATQLRGVKGVDPNLVAHLASWHHNPSNRYELLISIADRLASGHDRRGESADRDGRGEAPPMGDGPKGWEKVVATRLGNVFDRIAFGNAPARRTNGFSLRPLAPDTVFPDESAEKNTPKAYQTLWRAFMADLNTLLEHDLQEGQFETALDSLCENYLWCVPSSTKDGADISLYDHGRLCAAFASALYKYHEASGGFRGESAIADESAKKLALVAGDLSGIQNYLYALKRGDQAAKTLRARSFEIRMLTEVWSTTILEALGLPAACRFVNAGGHFLIAAPNTAEALAKLADLREEIERSFLRDYHGELALTISWDTVCSVADFKRSGMDSVVASAAEASAKAKQRKFQAALSTEDSSNPVWSNHVLSKAYDELLRCGPCPICGKNAADSDYQGEKRCRSCKTRSVWGAHLPKAEWLQVGKMEKGDSLAAGKHVYLAKVDEKLSFRDRTTNWSLNGFIPGLGRLNFPQQVPRREADAAERGGDGLPIYRKGDAIDFKDLASHSLGDPKLAIIKADVDNLGSIFSFGLGGFASLSRQMAISRQLDFFFNSWVDRHLATEAPNVYLVYSGGDELCAVGPWNEIVGFAFAFRVSLERLTGGNPAVGLSAGIVLVPPSLPIGTMAEQASDALERAKGRRNAVGALVKNAVTLFGTTVAWDTAAALIDKGKVLAKRMHTNENGRPQLSAGMVRRLLGYAEREAAFRKNPARPSSWRSALQYAAVRDIENIEARQEYVELALTAIPDGTVRIPAEYALRFFRAGGRTANGAPKRKARDQEENDVRL